MPKEGKKVPRLGKLTVDQVKSYIFFVGQVKTPSKSIRSSVFIHIYRRSGENSSKLYVGNSKIKMMA